jgi:hypothetical protein
MAETQRDGMQMKALQSKSDQRIDRHKSDRQGSGERSPPDGFLIDGSGR